jgi:hypothetical protein
VFFYLDEAGSFSIPSERGHSAAVSVAVVVSDNSRETLLDRYREFIGRLPGSAFDRGEPKGRLFSSDSLAGFADLLEDVKGIQVIPVTMDLGHLHGVSPKQLLDPFYEKLDLTACCMLYPTARQEVRTLSRQVRNFGGSSSLGGCPPRPSQIRARRFPPLGSSVG